MDLTAMIDAAATQFKQNLIAQCKNLDMTCLHPQLADQVTSGIQHALQAAGVHALRTFLEAYEVDETPKEVQGIRYRFKQVSAKTFLTPFGQMRLCRNLFQADKGGRSYVPLDDMWGMGGAYATVEVREAVLFAAALMTPEEVVALLEKSAFFVPSATAVKHIIEQMGQTLEAKGERLNARIREEECVSKDTEVFVASLDGTTLRLRARGKKRGRPQERPGLHALCESPTPTTFKQAMVGSLSFYSGIPEQGAKRQRLTARYVAQMPEKGWQSLKTRFEAELDHIENQIDDTVKKVLVLDGARNLWTYVKDTPRFDAYEKLIDFYHTTAHLATVAELLFGKKSPQGQRWYRSYYEKLKTQDRGAQRIIRSIDYHKKGRKMGQKRTDALASERTFFQRNKHLMTYAVFQKRGLPIGSGPVEAACKTLVKTRLCRSGMQWTWQGGQRILQLRTYVKSKRWARFWQAYKTHRFQDAERNNLHEQGHELEHYAYPCAA